MYVKDSFLKGKIPIYYDFLLGKVENITNSFLFRLIMVLCIKNADKMR